MDNLKLNFIVDKQLNIYSIKILEEEQDSRDVTLKVVNGWVSLLQ